MQLPPALVTLVSDSFFTFVELFDESTEPHPYNLLQDYIHAWLVRDEGVEATGGDYANYLQAVLIIIDKYTKEPSSLDYCPVGGEPRERRVSGLVDLDDAGAWCLDRHKYQEEVFRRMSRS